ncbi:MAG TPA: hypothetical protein VFX88_17755 [Actinomycetota bacterium]|nr:hypothetical protein [Actinomycetota bacterium]
MTATTDFWHPTRWLGALGHDLIGLWSRIRSRGWIAWRLGCSRPQGDHRDQHRRNHQVGG